MYRHLIRSASLCAAMMACVVVIPAASTTNNAAIQRKADKIFENVQSDARLALDRADNLESFRTPGIPGWSMVAAQLNGLRADVNDMAGQLQQLERLRRQAAPWQQAAIDHMSTSAHLLANYTTDAITFADSNPHDLWNPTYRQYLADAGRDAQVLVRTADQAVERAKLNRQEQPSGGNHRTSS